MTAAAGPGAARRAAAARRRGLRGGPPGRAPGRQRRRPGPGSAGPPPAAGTGAPEAPGAGSRSGGAPAWRAPARRQSWAARRPAAAAARQSGPCCRCGGASRLGARAVGLCRQRSCIRGEQAQVRSCPPSCPWVRRCMHAPHRRLASPDRGPYSRAGRARGPHLRVVLISASPPVGRGLEVMGGQARQCAPVQCAHELSGGSRIQLRWHPIAHGSQGPSRSRFTYTSIELDPPLPGSRGAALGGMASLSWFRMAVGH